MRKYLLYLLASLATAVLVTGCGNSGGTTQHDDSKDNASKASAAAFNEADVEFAQGMIPHHRQAVEMAALAPTRAEDLQVKKLAAQIKRAQDPEIRTMSAWLRSWGEDVPGDKGEDHGMDHGMDHGEMDMDEHMPGMMSGEQMSELETAKGAAFDRMFLEMMIEHHEGAIEMAETEQRDGKNAAAKKLAAKIEKSQTAEIDQMRKLLRSN
jgi:uncharacterized protein (DUF305 family)